MIYLSLLDLLLVGFFFLTEKPLSQFIVVSLPLHQFLVCSCLQDLSFVDHNDLICPFNCF